MGIHLLSLTLWCFWIGKNWPWFGLAWDHFWFATVDGGCIPGIIGLCVWLVGVRFSREQAFYLSYDASLTLRFIAGRFSPVMKWALAGNQCLPIIKEILGFNLQADSTRCCFVYCITAGFYWQVDFVGVVENLSSRLGKWCLAIAARNLAPRFIGYRTRPVTRCGFVVYSAVIAGICLGIVVTASCIITGRISPINSIEDGDLGSAVGGRGHLDYGAGELAHLLVKPTQNPFHSDMPGRLVVRFWADVRSCHPCIYQGLMGLLWAVTAKRKTL